MTASMRQDGVIAGRLQPADYKENFSDVHPPLTRHEAFVEFERCYFCSDAPCQTACPTSIDIPLFIRQIAAGNDVGATETILKANIWAACAPASAQPKRSVKKPACANMPRASR